MTIDEAATVLVDYLADSYSPFSVEIVPGQPIIITAEDGSRFHVTLSHPME